MKTASSPDLVGFRERGREVTRLESFSDAVFGFALTLLFVSLDVPKTYAYSVNNILDTISQQSQGFVPGLLEILTFRHQHDGQHARGGSSLFVPQAEWRGP